MTRDQFAPDAPILTDREALENDLSSNTDTTYHGNRLRLITARPNPVNPKKGVVLYTAQCARDVIGINSVFHGPTDWVVAKELEILEAGNYVKQSGNWGFPANK